MLDAIEHILRQDQNNLQVLLDFDNLGVWVKEHAPDVYAAAVEAGTPQVQTAPDTAAVRHPAREERPYDVALSFAGEDREHADALAARLGASDVRVFYDKYEEALLWGRDLYTHLVDVYQHQAQYCVLFLSKHYAEKAWTKHELHAAQARAFQENREYILPVRLDSTEIPGLLPTVGYLACPPHTAETIATAVISKLGRPIADQSDGVADDTSSAPVPLDPIHMALFPQDTLWSRTQARTFIYRTVCNPRFPPFFMIAMTPVSPIAPISLDELSDRMFRRLCAAIFGPTDAFITEPDGNVFDPVAIGLVRENEHSPHACAFVDGSIGVHDSISFASHWDEERPIPLKIDPVGLWRLLQRVLQTIELWPREVGHATGPLEVRLSLGNLEKTIMSYPPSRMDLAPPRVLNRVPIWDSPVMRWSSGQDVNDLLDAQFALLARQLQFGAYPSHRAAIRAEANEQAK